MTDFKLNGQETIRLPFDANTYPEIISTACLYSPEIATQEETLKVVSRSLVDIYKPTADFFDAYDNAIGLILAAGLVANSQATAGKTALRIQREVRTADSFSWLLFGDYSPVRPHQGEKKISDLSKEERIALFHRYENPEMSNRLREWMAMSPEMAQVREELNIPTEEAREFIPIVLRAGGPVHMHGVGEAPGSANMAAKVKMWLRNGKRFMIEQGSAKDDTLPYAWVSTLNGGKYLCFPEPIAYALLDPQEIGFDDSEGVTTYLRSLTQHEYVHVQTRLDISDPHDEEKGGRIGGLLTEYQAEVFSGCNMDGSYPDIYDFVEGCETAGGFSISDVMRSHKKGGGADKVGFYLDWVNKIGLVPAAMLAGAMTEDDLKYQSTEAGRELASISAKYSLADELTVRRGWDGVVERYQRLGIKLTKKRAKFWRDHLLTLAES